MNFLTYFRKSNPVIAVQPILPTVQYGQYEIPVAAVTYIQLLKPYTVSEIRQIIFNKYLDTESDGEIELYEFMYVMEFMLVNSSKSLDDIVKSMSGEERTMELTVDQCLVLRQNFKFLDINKDGTISLTEILKWNRIINFGFSK